MQPQASVTWNSCEELDGVAVPVEGELSVSHGAVGNERPGRDFVAAVVTVNTNHAPRLVPCRLGGLAGC